MRLANRLQDLGFGVKPEQGDFEIVGIPPEVLKRFSRRTVLIEKLALERGITNPKWKSELGPKTRERWKGSPWSLDALREEWNKRLTEQERAVLVSVYRRETPHAQQVNGAALAVDHAIEHCVMRSAAVPERQVITEALKHGLGAVTVEDVAREVANRPLVRSNVSGSTMVTFL